MKIIANFNHFKSMLPNIYFIYIQNGEFMAYHTAYNDFIIKIIPLKIEKLFPIPISASYSFFLAHFCTYIHRSKHIANKYVSKNKLMSLIFNENPQWKTHGIVVKRAKKTTFFCCCCCIIPKAGITYR